jgi:hypothetical protein
MKVNHIFERTEIVMEENKKVEAKKVKTNGSLKKKALLATVFALGALSMYVSVWTVLLVFIAMFIVPTIFSEKKE